MSQFIFELKMYALGAWYAIPVTLRLVTGPIMILSVMVVGVGCLLRSVSRKLCFWLALFGISCFLFVVVAPRWFGFSYGNDSSAKVSALGSGLLQGDTLPASAIQQLGSNQMLFISGPVAKNGHAYVALNRLGKSTLTPEELLAKVATNLNAVFPIYAKGKNGNSIQQNNEFGLGRILVNPVMSSALNGHYFVLVTEPGHALVGTANHGIVRDSSGVLWLFQYGLGTNNEMDWGQLWNYPLAKYMWSEMAANIATGLHQYFEVSNSSASSTSPGVKVGSATNANTSATTCSLIVLIAPASTESIGAQWRVDSGKWNATGATVSGLTTGQHVVGFKPVNGWNTPTNQTVSLSLRVSGAAVGIYTITSAK